LIFLVGAGTIGERRVFLQMLPRHPFPTQDKPAEGWPIKNIAEKTGFSPDTVSKYLKETGAKEEKAAEGVGGAVDVSTEFEAFKAKKRLELQLPQSLHYF